MNQEQPDLRGFYCDGEELLHHVNNLNIDQMRTIPDTYPELVNRMKQL